MYSARRKWTQQGWRIFLLAAALGVAWYNKACSYSLQGNIEQAIENLKTAISLNLDKYREMAKTDSDFDAIREDERFQELIK